MFGKSFSEEVVKHNKNKRYVKQMADITDEEGLEQAYESNDGLHQHYNKLFIVGTRDFPTDHIDGLRLPFNDTLKLLGVVMLICIIEVTMKSLPL